MLFSGSLLGRGLGGVSRGSAGLAATACLSVGLLLLLRGRVRAMTTSTARKSYTRSPGATQLPGLSKTQVEALPYPPDALPGGRDVATPYGTIRVYEWGPETGERVLFLHGISTPTVSLGDLGHELVGRGYRVMLFDLFGRGYSDAPDDIPYDSRLYISQILLVLTSSKLAWTESPGFHLVGYSLGGCLCVPFARYFPEKLLSLNLVATSGLLRPYHVSPSSRVLYNSGILPEFLVRWLVRRRIRPAADPPSTAGAADLVAAEGQDDKSPTLSSSSSSSWNGDASGGKEFDSAPISRHRPSVTVSSVVRWQIDNHKGFIQAFLSTIRCAPIYASQEDWKVLSTVLEARRAGPRGPSPEVGLPGGKTLIVLGDRDEVIDKDETVEDAQKVLGVDGVEFAIIPGGHELPITDSTAVADSLVDFWRR